MGKRRRHDDIETTTSEQVGCKKPRKDDTCTWLQGLDLARKRFSCQYRMGALIEKGHSGRVSLLHRHDPSTESVESRPLVCKLMPKKRELAIGTANPVEPDTYQKSILMEARSRKVLGQHPYINRLIEMYEDDDSVQLVYEACTQGELPGFFAERKSVSNRDIAFISRQLITVIGHCHWRGIVLRHLRPDNILIHDGTVQLAGLGACAFHWGATGLDTRKAHPRFCAPEVFGHNFGTPADIWSAGVTIYAMCCGQLPFHGTDDHALGKAIKEQDVKFSRSLFKDIDRDAIEMLKAMLSKDPRNRPTAPQLLGFQFLARQQSIVPVEGLPARHQLYQKRRGSERANFAPGHVQVAAAVAATAAPTQAVPLDKPAGSMDVESKFDDRVAAARPSSEHVQHTTRSYIAPPMPENWGSAKQHRPAGRRLRHVRPDSAACRSIYDDLKADPNCVPACRWLLPPLSHKNVAPFESENGEEYGWTYLMCGQGPHGRYHPEHLPEYFKCDVHSPDWAWNWFNRCPLSVKHMLVFVSKWMHLVRRRQGAWLARCKFWMCVCCGVGTGQNYRALINMLSGLDFVLRIRSQADHGAIFVQVAPL